MTWNYDEWLDKHSDSIALAIGGMYATILITLAILIWIYEK